MRKILCVRYAKLDKRGLERVRDLEYLQEFYLNSRFLFTRLVNFVYELCRHLVLPHHS